MTRTACAVIAEALACVARECPVAYASMRAVLGPRAIEVAIGDEVLHLDLEGALRRPAIAVRTSVDALCALLDGELALLDAVLDRRLDVTGDPAELAAASEATAWFLEGAVRCTSIEPLTDRLFELRKGVALR